MKKKTKAVANTCPCGSNLPYSNCCAIWHRRFDQDQTQPEDGTPEGLMRSRYTAYVLGLEAYLLATWTPQSRPEHAVINNSGLKWLGLRILRAQTDVDGLHATVEFIARSRQDGKGQRHHEISRFKRISGQWRYLDGDLQ